MPLDMNARYKEMPTKKSVVEYLKDRPREWFTVDEIADAVGRCREQVRDFLATYRRTRREVQWKRGTGLREKLYRWSPCR